MSGPMIVEFNPEDVDSFAVAMAKTAVQSGENLESVASHLIARWLEKVGNAPLSARIIVVQTFLRAYLACLVNYQRNN